MNKMGRVLAIDFGKKRVGLAVTDPLQIIASGLTTVARREAIEYIETYTQREEVEKIIIGYPMGLDGQPTDTTKAVEHFTNKLSKILQDIPVEYVDERFTSKMAMESLLQSGVPKKKRQNKALLDEVSATIMLQDYLSQKN